MACLHLTAGQMQEASLQARQLPCLAVLTGSFPDSISAQRSVQPTESSPPTVRSFAFFFFLASASPPSAALPPLPAASPFLPPAGAAAAFFLPSPLPLLPLPPLMPPSFLPFLRPSRSALRRSCRARGGVEVAVSSLL